MLSYRSLCTSVALALLAVNNVNAANILFVGNSFTYGKADPVLTYWANNVTDPNGTGYGGVPGVFKHIATTAGKDFNVTIEAVSGQTLAFHAANKADIISRAGWDIVVLQEYSTLPVPAERGGDPDLFAQGVHDVVNLVRGSNPNTPIYLYETWVRPDKVYPDGAPYHGEDFAEMQLDLHNGYEQQAGVINAAGVAWVGDEFIRAVDAGFAAVNSYNPIPEGEVDLWWDDHYHASKYGSYIAAVSLFSLITESDPTSVPNGDGTAAAGLGISPDIATKLQSVISNAKPSTPGTPSCARRARRV